MAMVTCSFTTRIALLVASGVGLGVAALLCFIFLPLIVEHVVKQKLILSPDSLTYDTWRETPVPIYAQFYIFNVTNPDAVLHSGETPFLEELGPYTFREYREKVNISWDHDNGTVSYQQIRRWNFIREKTEGSLTDEVIHLNVPMVAAGNDIQYKEGIDREVQQHALNDLVEQSNSTLFQKHTVGELLFYGYDDMILDIGHELNEGLLLDKFGWFYSRNDTASDGTFRIFTGENGNIAKLGLLDTWNYRHSLNKWFDEDCNRIDETSPGDFRPPFKRPIPKSINLFVGDICRSLRLEFLQEIDFKGVKCNRYWASSSLFDYTLKENECYCGEKGCPPNGVLNVATCTLGSPTAISFPHFLYADTSHSKKVRGLNPNPMDHSFYVDIEPTLGVPINIAARMQINIRLERNENLNFAENLPESELYFPQFWYNVVAHADDEMTGQIILLTKTVPFYITLTAFCFIILSGLILIYSTIYAFNYKRDVRTRSKQKYEAVEVISTSFSSR